MKKLLSVALALAMTVSLSVSAFAAPAAQEAQDYVTAKGWMTGTDKGFEPEKTVDRATLYEMFWKMEGSPAVTNKMATFPDAVGKWFETSARWAEQMELTTGTGKGYEGERVVTKAETAAILYRYANLKGITLPEGEEHYPDAAWLVSDFSVPQWAAESFAWAIRTGIVEAAPDAAGEGIGYYPGNTVTRAELAQMLTVMGQGMETVELPVTGKAMAASKYGNVGTDIPAKVAQVGDILKVEITGQEPLMVPYGTGYSNVDQGSPIAMEDTSNGTLALAINRGDFATTYGLGKKNEDSTYTMDQTKTITVSMGEAGGYLQEMELRAIDDKRTNERADYASDEVFANFRAITVGDIADGRLYRGSSPVNPELGRNTYADALIKGAGVKAVLNLADSEEVMKGYEGYGESYYSTIAVMPLNLGVDTAADDFNAGLKEGLVWLSQQKGPYYFHCTEGKDRAGFVAALLEMLCGATLRDVVGDYMLSFQNYYFVKADGEQWHYIAESNIEKSVLDITGAEDIFAAGDMDLAKAAEKYLQETVGLTAKEVTALKDALTK